MLHQINDILHHQVLAIVWSYLTIDVGSSITCLADPMSQLGVNRQSTTNVVSALNVPYDKGQGNSKIHHFLLGSKLKENTFHTIMLLHI